MASFLQHEGDGLVLLVGQAGEVDVELQLTAQLPGPKCSDSSSWEASCQSQLEVWFVTSRAKVENSRTGHLKR